MAKKIIIIGGVGNGTVVASTVEDVIQDGGDWELLGYLNDFEPEGSLINGCPVLGKVPDVSRFNAKDCYFIYTLVTVKKASERIQKLLALELPLERFATIVHPTATVSRYVKLGYGVVLMPGVVISPNVTIGNHTQLYGNSFVGHDTTIGDYCFIANCASVGGRVVVEDGVHIGSNASVIEKVTIGSWSLVGLGSVVLKDVPPFAKVVGNPARIIGYLEGKEDEPLPPEYSRLIGQK